MSYLEKARDLLLNPADYNEVVNSRNTRNKIVARFYLGEIDGETLRNELTKSVETLEPVYLPFPGPLYGLLRKLGLNKEFVNEIVEEERAHYLATKRWELKTKTGLMFYRDKTEPANNGVRKILLDVFISYEIPPYLNDHKIRQALEEIALAPKNPSKDDLAKLGL